MDRGAKREDQIRNVQSTDCEGAPGGGSAMSEGWTGTGAITLDAVTCVAGGAIRDWLVGTSNCETGAGFADEIRQQVELCVSA